MSVLQKAIEHADHWLLSLTGKEVSLLLIDYAFGLTFVGDGEADSAHLRIGGTFKFVDADTTLELDPEQTMSLYPALSLSRKTVEVAIAEKSGTLRIDFTDGVKLSVEAREKYEAWELSGMGGLLFVSMPSGGLAFWVPE